VLDGRSVYLSILRDHYFPKNDSTPLSLFVYWLATSERNELT